jgi:hypothetical protein
MGGEVGLGGGSCDWVHGRLLSREGGGDPRLCILKAYSGMFQIQLETWLGTKEMDIGMLWSV